MQVLPLGGSKGEGVRRLLSSLGVAASDVLAIGDAENDLEVSTRRQSGEGGGACGTMRSRQAGSPRS